MSRGRITTEFTIWCGADDCQHWEQDAMAGSKREATDGWRLDGWRKIKGVWTCRDCAAGKKWKPDPKSRTIVWFPPSDDAAEAQAGGVGA